MTFPTTTGSAASRPLSSFVERLLARLPRSGWRLIAAVLSVLLISLVITAALTPYVTHEEVPLMVLWDGRLHVAPLLIIVVFTPLANTILVLTMAFLIPWLSPLFGIRASRGQTVIGAALIIGGLDAIVLLASAVKGFLIFALTTHVYLEHRRMSWLKAAWMAFVVQAIFYGSAAALLFTTQRWFADA